MTHEIHSTDFDQLNFMIPDMAFLSHQISLVMVFIDDINGGMEIIIHLQNHLPDRLHLRGSELI